jgi:xylulose-5-phosphate/fructose-6-phosphate phosphoketolase
MIDTRVMVLERNAPDLADLDLYWRAANYLGAAQLYLKENTLLRRPLEASHIKPRILGHWGTQPGINLIYAHLNHLIARTKAEMLLIVGPGHGAPAVLANLFLEGTLHEYHSELSRDRMGVERFVRRFSWPGGAASHVTAATPGAIHEGGELGYSLSHAYGAAFDHPDLIVACIVGDGEAETGPLAASWQSNKFLDPRTCGAVLPIVHLNGIKLSGPTILGRVNDDEIRSLFVGYGYEPLLVTSEDDRAPHLALRAAFDAAHAMIRGIQERARRGGERVTSPRWPVIVLRTLKGMTGPKTLEGIAIEGTYRCHGIPIPDPANNHEQLRALDSWLRSYQPDELFEEDGSPAAAILRTLPPAELCLGRSAIANGTLPPRDLTLPDTAAYAVAVPAPGAVDAEATVRLGSFLTGIFTLNKNERNFRLFSPDETISNKLDAVFQVTDRAFVWPTDPLDEHLSPSGRVMEILSEHTCQGWLEGYLLSGRHGMFASYEAFITIVDSMVAQHAKWLKEASEVSWRRPPASLNYLLTSHLWRQDHNGFSHQSPAFIDALLNKKSSTVRIYLPPDANCLLSVANHCLRSRGYVNVIIAPKHASPQWLDAEAANAHCALGASVWEWASSNGTDPEVVLAAAGDVPMLETLAAAQLLREHVPNLRVRVVNVVDLFAMAIPSAHKHGLDELAFEALFTASRPVIFAFHGYPRVIHELLHHRPAAERFHVRGFEEEGTTSTPFDAVVRNGMSRYHLALEALRRAQDGAFAATAGCSRAIELFERQITRHRAYINEHDLDLPEVQDWRWG